MAWDSSRPVPWRRLVREWLIYVVIAGVVISIYLAISKGSFDVGLYAGLLVSGPMYILFGALLAKFGYQRKTFRELRTERATTMTSGSSRSATTATAARPKPAPTKRTSAGPNRPQQKKRR